MPFALRLPLTVCVLAALAVAGFFAAGWWGGSARPDEAERAELATEDALWRSLVATATLRLAAAGAPLAQAPDVARTAGSGDPAALGAAMSPVNAVLESHPPLRRWEVVSREGDLLYSSAGVPFDAPVLDVGFLRRAAAGGGEGGGLMARTDGAGFLVAALLPLGRDERGAVTALGVLAADPGPVLAEFAHGTGAAAILVDRSGHPVAATDPALERGLRPVLSVRRRHWETRVVEGRAMAVAVLPVRDAENRVVGALVAARDVSPILRDQSRVVGFALLALVAGVVALGLWLRASLRQSWAPVERAWAVLAEGWLSPSGEEDGPAGLAANLRRLGEVLAGETRAWRRDRRRLRRRLSRVRHHMRSLTGLLDPAERIAVEADLATVENPSGTGDEGTLADELVATRLADATETLAAALTRRLSPAAAAPPEETALAGSERWEDTWEADSVREEEGGDAVSASRDEEDEDESAAAWEGDPVGREGGEHAVPGDEESGATEAEGRPFFPPDPDSEREDAAAAAEIPRLDMTVVNDLADVERLMKAVEAFFAAHRLPARLAFALNLCLEELLSHAIRAGYDDGGRHEIRVVLTREGGDLAVEIRDDARLRDPFVEGEASAFDGANTGLGALGLYLIKDFADRRAYRVEGGCNVVTLWRRWERGA